MWTNSPSQEAARSRKVTGSSCAASPSAKDAASTAARELHTRLLALFLETQLLTVAPSTR